MVQKKTDTEDDVETSKRAVKIKQDQHYADMNWILSDPRGRRVVWKYMSDCMVFKSSFTGNNTTFFNEGRREVGLWLHADVIKARPEAYLLMSKEAEQGEKND